MAKANINTQMLTWARERSGIPVLEFAHKCVVSEEKTAGLGEQPLAVLIEPRARHARL